MLKLSASDLIKGDENCYSFVIAIAKKARQIAETANEENEMLDEKPVQMAVREYTDGEFHIVETPVAEDEPTGKHQDVNAESINTDGNAE